MMTKKKKEKKTPMFEIYRKVKQFATCSSNLFDISKAL